MINIKPIIYNINSFDATIGTTIEYQYTGNQQFKNICIVRNNSTNMIVYQKTVDTMQLKHTIEPNELSNGILYNVTIQVVDSQGNVSEPSTPVLFYCFTTPTFIFSNLVENQVVQNSSYQVTLKYNQPEDEELQYYQLHLYNTNKNQIWSSGVKYDTNLSVTLVDLDDNGVYYARATGRTINGMDVDTGYVRFSVNYVMPSIYALVTLENIKDEGSIKIQSNILSLEAKYHGNDHPNYLYDNYIDLTNPDTYVYMDEGFDIKNDFTINLKGYGFADFSTILQLSNSTKTITVTKKKGIYLSAGNVEKTYFELKVPCSSFAFYVIRSNYIDNPDYSDILSIWVRRVNNVYNLYVENLSKN